LQAPGTDDERLLKEVVYFADRSDISEELTRLQSHFQQFEDGRKSKEPWGGMLDFLAQEINREVNTIGSKANDSLISREVVTLKAELEKFASRRRMWSDERRNSSTENGEPNQARGVAQPAAGLISAPSGGGKTTLCQQLLATRPQMTRA